MQEEITQRTVSLSVEAAKMTADLLQKAMKKVLDEMQKDVTGHKTKLHHGKQTLTAATSTTPGVPPTSRSPTRTSGRFPPPPRSTALTSR